MTPRERLLHLIHGRRADCISVAPFIHINVVKEFADTDGIDLVTKTVDVYDHFGFDIIHRNCTPAYHDVFDVSSPQWQVTRTTTRRDHGTVTESRIVTPDGALTETYKSSPMTRFDAEAAPVKYLVKSPSDFECICRYQPPVVDFDTAAILRATTATGDKGIVAPWVHGAFNHVAFFYRPLDALILDAMTDPDFYHAMMRYFLDRNKRIIARIAAAKPDAVAYAANIAGGKLVGPAFFEEFIFPYEKELISFTHNLGVRVIYHNCGYASKLLPLYAKLGMAVYESLTPPPFGDTILEDAVLIMLELITLSGNIDQIEFLRTADPDAIRARVYEVMETVRLRGTFILAATDYFTEGTPYDNIRAFARAALDYTA